MYKYLTGTEGVVYPEPDCTKLAEVLQMSPAMKSRRILPLQKCLKAKKHENTANPFKLINRRHVQGNNCGSKHKNRAGSNHV